MRDRAVVVVSGEFGICTDERRGRGAPGDARQSEAGRTTRKLDAGTHPPRSTRTMRPIPATIYPEARAVSSVCEFDLCGGAHSSWVKRNDFAERVSEKVAERDFSALRASNFALQSCRTRLCLFSRVRILQLREVDHDAYLAMKRREHLRQQQMTP
jgi:hypothetical protein